MTGASGVSDADLVAGVLAGDRDAFAQVYDKYADRLHDFAYSMLRQREDAMDAVADAFVTTAERLDQLRDPDRLRPWLYSVVRRECLRRLKSRSRTSYGGDDDLLDLPDQAAGPETMAEQKALQALVWDAAAGLNERDRAMLDLHLRQGLEGAELGEAMGMSADNAYVGLSRLRDQVERSIGALLVARTSQHTCGDLDGVLGDWDGEFTPLVRKRVARHVDKCAACTRRRALVASPAALLAGVPAFAAPAMLRDRVLEDSRLVSALSSRSGRSGGSGGVAAGSRRRGADPWTTAGAPRLVLLGTVAAVLAILVGIGLWQQGVGDEPTDLVADAPSSLVPTPSSEAPSSDPRPPRRPRRRRRRRRAPRRPRARHRARPRPRRRGEQPEREPSTRDPIEEAAHGGAVSESPTVTPPGRLERRAALAGPGRVGHPVGDAAEHRRLARVVHRVDPAGLALGIAGLRHPRSPARAVRSRSGPSAAGCPRAPRRARSGSAGRRAPSRCRSPRRATPARSSVRWTRCRPTATPR